MPAQDRPDSAPPPGPAEMPRPLRLDRLPRSGPHHFDETATPAERAAIAALLGARAVGRFRFSGMLRPEGAEGWRLEGRLRARIVQACVVTLEDVVQRIDEPVLRRYLPGIVAAAEVDPDAPEEDEMEPLPRRLDLGAVAIEAAALALDPWPRRPGAHVAQAIDPDDPPAENPFAALASLRRPGADEG